MRNLVEDQNIIKTAFEKLEIFTWFNTHILLFMGTDLYSEDLKFHKLLNKFLGDLADKCSSTTSISLTLLNGDNIGFRTKGEVKGHQFNRWSTSLNQDLENFHEDMIRASAQMRYLIRRHLRMVPTFTYDSYDRRFIPIILDRALHQSFATELFLYEMQSEDDIKTRTDDWNEPFSDDHQFMLSCCKRLSYYLKF